jgi:hypothetical protein
MTRYFDSDVIATEYERLGYRHGWTFMMTPEARMRDAAVAFIGLNPGGGGPGDNHEYAQTWDCSGNAYFTEKWGPGATDFGIQAQVKAWHRILCLSEDDTWCAQLVPFRSRDWNALAHRNEALAFSAGLWRWALDQSPATLLVTMGRKTADALVALLDGKHVASMPTGWGAASINVWDTPTGKRIVGMPHPSRYKLFNRGDDLSVVAERSFRVAAGLRDHPSVIQQQAGDACLAKLTR